MSKKLRVASLLLAATLAVSSFVGCNSSSSTSSTSSSGTSSSADAGDEDTGLVVNVGERPLVDETYTLTIATRINDGQPSNDDITFWDGIEEQTNVHIEWSETLDSAWDEKKNVLIASADQPDVYFSNYGFTDDEVFLLGSGGKFIEVSDLIDEYMPNLTAYYAENEDWEQVMTAPDGNMYSLPSINAANYGFQNGPMLNMAMVENLEGLSFEPTTTESMTIEQFEELLVAIKEQDANGNGDTSDEIPFNLGSNYQSALMAFGASFGVFGGYENAPVYLKDGEVVCSYTTDEYRTYINWLNSLWTQGLIDKEYFTQDSTTYNAKFNNTENIIGVTTNWREGTTACLPIQPLEVEGYDVAWPFSTNVQIQRGTYMITSSCEEPGLAAAWADNLYEYYNSIEMCSSQLFGEHIEENEDGMFDEIRALDWEREGEYNLVAGNMTRLNIYTQEMKDKLVVQSPVNVQKGPVESQYAESGYNSGSSTTYPYHLIWLEEDDATTITTIRSELEPYTLSQASTWITTDGIDDAEWEAYQKSLVNLGVEDIVAIYAAYYVA